MTSGMRWRIFVLQIGLIGILGFVSGFAFWASNFATSTVHDQLAAQQIYFPAAGTPALTALPKADDIAMTQYAGQELLTGAQARFTPITSSTCISARSVPGRPIRS